MSILGLCFYLYHGQVLFLDGKIKFSASMPPNFSIINWALLGYYRIGDIASHQRRPPGFGCLG